MIDSKNKATDISKLKKLQNIQSQAKSALKRSKSQQIITESTLFEKLVRLDRVGNERFEINKLIKQQNVYQKSAYELALQNQQIKTQKPKIKRVTIQRAKRALQNQMQKAIHKKFQIIKNIDKKNKIKKRIQFNMKNLGHGLAVGVQGTAVKDIRSNYNATIRQEFQNIFCVPIH